MSSLRPSSSSLSDDGDPVFTTTAYSTTSTPRPASSTSSTRRSSSLPDDEDSASTTFSTRPASTASIPRPSSSRPSDEETEFTTAYSTTSTRRPASTTSTPSPTPTPANPSGNLIPENPSFESGALGWLIEGEADYVNSPVHDGSVALVHRFSNVAPGSSINFWQVMAADPGSSYVASLWWMQTNAEADCYMFLLVDGDPAYNLIDTRNFGAGTWTELRLEFVAPGSATRVSLIASCRPIAANAGEEFANVVYFDDAKLVKTS